MLGGSHNWEALCDTWDTCGRIWDCLVEMIETAPGGGMEEYDWIQRHSLENEDRTQMVSLYVEIFKDHLSSEEKSLLETAGIKLTYVNKVEVNEKISVILKGKKIYSESIKPTHKDIQSIKTFTLEQLVKALKIK